MLVIGDCNCTKLISGAMRIFCDRSFQSIRLMSADYLGVILGSSLQLLCQYFVSISLLFHVPRIVLFLSPVRVTLIAVCPRQLLSPTDTPDCAFTIPFRGSV